MSDYPVHDPDLGLAHDLGGMRGFGSVDRSQSELFAKQWEESVFGMTLACGMLGRWNLDQSRCAREQMEPAHYLAGSYYEHWLHGLELLLVEHGLVSETELQSGESVGGGELPAVERAQIAKILRSGASTQLPADTAPRFAIDTRVTVRAVMPQPHTRAPRYTHGRHGIIVYHHGAHVFPDAHAARGEKQSQHLYSVRFETEQLWDEKETGRLAVYVDLFEAYLEAVDGAS